MLRPRAEDADEPGEIHRRRVVVTRIRMDGGWSDVLTNGSHVLDPGTIGTDDPKFGGAACMQM